MSYNQLFYRKNTSKISNINYVNSVFDSLNKSNIEKINIKKVMNLYNPKYADWFVWYRFSLLNNWFKENYNLDSFNFYESLINIIRNLNLLDFLNAKEKNFLINLKSQNFTKLRNLKTLMVDFELKKFEHVYFHYRKIKFDAHYIKSKETDLYLSNNRIILTFRNEIISLYYEDIESITWEQNGFYIKLNNSVFKIITNKNQIIKISLEIIFKMIKKETLWT